MNEAKMAYAYANQGDVPSAPREETPHVGRLTQSIAETRDLCDQLAKRRASAKHELERAIDERDDLTRYIERLEQTLAALADCHQRVDSLDAPTTLNGYMGAVGR